LQISKVLCKAVQEPQPQFDKLLLPSCPVVQLHDV